jgi:hypothetical protein
MLLLIGSVLFGILCFPIVLTLAAQGLVVSLESLMIELWESSHVLGSSNSALPPLAVGETPEKCIQLFASGGIPPSVLLLRVQELFRCPFICVMFWCPLHHTKYV